LQKNGAQFGKGILLSFQRGGGAFKPTTYPAKGEKI